MRKARYDLQQVICRNSSLLGYATRVVRPGYWVAWTMSNDLRVGRVMGRVAETDLDGANCAGWLVVMLLDSTHSHAYTVWVDPLWVTYAVEKPPKELLTWITGDEWVKNKEGLHRLLAMSQHGTTSEQYIASRNDPDKPYNSRPAYVSQWILS
jgi:hypothetical protein